MRFTIDGIEYEDYELSNSQIVKLIESNALMGSEKAFLMEKAYARLKHSFYLKDGETDDTAFARFFSDYVNKCPNDFKAAAKEMCRAHRYLQNEMFKLFLEYVKALANSYENGFYDERNSYAVETSKKIMTFLNEVE